MCLWHNDFRMEATLGTSRSFVHGESQAQTQDLVHSRERVRCYLCPSSLGLPLLLTQRCPGSGHQCTAPVFRYLGPSEGAEGLSHPQTWVVKLNPAPLKRAVLVGGGSTKA